MDYFEILLVGICSPNEREHLDKYLIREQKKAEKEYFEAEEFFSGLDKAVEELERFVKNQVHDLRTHWEDVLKYGSEEGKEIARAELDNFNPNNSPFNLAHLDSKHNRGREGIYVNFSNIAAIKDAINKAEASLQTSERTEQFERKKNEVKFIAKEYALAYIFDLYANGQQVPTNRVEGGLNAKELNRIGKEEKGFNKPDTFYRAVKDVLKLDLNKKAELQGISKDWIDAVKNLSTNWGKTKEYLKLQGLIED